MSGDLHNFKDSWRNPVIFTRKLKSHHIIYSYCDTGEKTLAVLNIDLYCDTGEKTLAVLSTDRHIFVNKVGRSFLKYLHLEYVTENILNQ